MKLYSKFIKFIQNKNIRNFPLIEVVVDDKQMNSWDCFFQIEEYPEETTHFECFEKEFQKFFLKQLSEDLENFVQLQPVINVHFRILDWNLLKDDYIWKKHYQYMLDKLLTYPDIDKELISCFRTTPFIYVDSKKCLFVKDKNFDKNKKDITEIFNIELFQSKLSQLQCLMLKIYKFEFQFELIFTFKDLEEIKKSKKNITSNQQIKIKGYVQHHAKYHDLKWNKIGFELVDPENFLNFIVVNSWLPKKTKKFEEISQKLIDLLPEGSLVLINIKIVKKIYYNLEDLEEFEILEQIPEQRYLFPEIFIDEDKFEEEFKLFFNKLRINRILIECCVQHGEKHDPKKNRFYLVDPNSHQDSILITEWLNNFNIYNQKSSLIDIPAGTLILATISINEKSIKDKVVYFSLVRYKKLELKIKLDDYSGTKRIEFHTHTKMSNLDAIVSVKDYIELVEKWGHKSIAFTDHDGLYAFPEIAKNVKGKNIKAILGVELSFLEEKSSFITNQEVNLNKFSDFCLQNHNYIVLDIETTGFSKNRDSIISIAAIKIKDGKFVDFFDELINPGDNIKINDFIQKLTNISNEMVAIKPHIKKVFLKFLEFINNCSDCVLVAHNASFDIDFLKETAKKNGLIWPLLPVIDTLFLAQKHFNEIFKYFSLERIVKSLKIKLDLNDFKNFASYEMVEIFKTKFDRENQYHNALFDVYATSRIFLEMLQRLKQKQILSFYDLRGTFDNKKFERPYHVNILVKNKQGYKNLFRLISDALTKDFIRKPLLVKSNFEKNREGLLIGSGCFDSNVFNIALYKNDDELAQAISYYDYIEVQPPQAYRHIIYDLNGSSIDDGNNSYGLQIIKDTIKKIIVESLKQNKIIIATGDVHYLYPYEKVLREVYINAKLIGGGLHRLSEYPSEHLPDNYFLTTKEMLDAFSFIPDENLKQDLVINNTHVLDRQIEKFDFLTDKLFDIPDDMFSQNLNISSINKEFNGLINKRIIELFEEKMHPLVKCRIMQELSVILPQDTFDNNNIVAIYYLSYLLVKRSTEDGYPVGSRGSVGASLIANILGITEINPLPPHYRCIKCKYMVLKMNLNQTKTSEYYDYVQSWPFFVDVLNYQKNFDNIFSGYDLPNEKCPFCHQNFSKDGQDIPFETFLGFDGNRKPDIDLNFSGDYQNKIHNYLREMLGESFVFRAGTIQTVAKQNAYGYIKAFVKERNVKIRRDERERRILMIEGVKRSTGQHPGGIIIIPKGFSIYDFTPIQFPANDSSSDWKTTHFDYHALEKNLFKLDILGHDDPTLIKFLMDGVIQNPEKFPFKKFQDIPLDDQQVYEIFANQDDCKTSQAIPEFGTFFVRNMLKEIYLKEKKFSFSTLIKISGLSHGTGVWSGNAQKILFFHHHYIEYCLKLMGFSAGISFDITNLIFKDQYLSIKNIIDYGFNNKIVNQINTYFEYKIHDYFEDKIALINNLKNTEFIIKFGIDRYFGLDNLEKYENFLNTNMKEIFDFSKFGILEKSFIIDRNSNYKQILDYHKIKEFLNKISDKILEKFNIKYEFQNDLNQIFNNDNNQIKIDNCKQIELFLNKISEDITKSNCFQIELFLKRNFEEILTNNNISDYDQKKHFNKCLNCLICQTKEFLFDRILDMGNLMKIQIKEFFVNKVLEIRNLLKKDQNDIINCQSKENLNNEYIELFPFSLSVCKDMMVNGTCVVFDDIIFCRDEIMNYLISKGLEKLIAFEIMELVRKGKQNNDRQKWSDLSKIMREHNVNDWYIESLQKIQYLFPKPHAAAYVLMALRIAWFKVHAPLLFYKGYFSTRVSQFDYENMMLTTDKIAQILQKSNEKDMKTVQKEKLHTLKIAKEMKDRGYNFLPIDLNKSEANLFVMEVSSNSLIMPFITIDGLGQVGANNIVKARGEKLFTQQDFEKRVKLNKTILKKFHDLNLIQQLPLE